MYYTSLSKIIDDVFTFPYGIPQKLGDPSFVYDLIKKEKDGSTKIEVVIPGYAKEDLKLNVVDNTLTLSCDVEGKNFSRKWRLSETIDVKKIKAECKNGILIIFLSEKQRDSKTTNINIE